MHNSTSFPASRGTGGNGTQHLGVSPLTDQVLDPGAGRLSGRQRHHGSHARTARAAGVDAVLVLQHLNLLSICSRLWRRIRRGGVGFLNHKPPLLRRGLPRPLIRLETLRCDAGDGHRRLDQRRIVRVLRPLPADYRLIGDHKPSGSLSHHVHGPDGPGIDPRLGRRTASRGKVDTGPRRRLDIRPLLVPPGVLLVGVGRLDHAWFVEGFTRYLHAHWQPRLGKTAWH